MRAATQQKHEMIDVKGRILSKTKTARHSVDRAGDKGLASDAVRSRIRPRPR